MVLDLVGTPRVSRALCASASVASAVPTTAVSAILIALAIKSRRHSARTN
jgi:hypothetical protein